MATSIQSYLIYSPRSTIQDPEIAIQKLRSRNRDLETVIQKSLSRNCDPEIEEKGYFLRYTENTPIF